MRYYLDTEFIESGPHLPIELVSVALVAEDGRELYMQSCEYNAWLANNWVKQNVFSHLAHCWVSSQHDHWSALIREQTRGSVGPYSAQCDHNATCPWYALHEIRDAITAFVGADPTPPVFYGWYSAYDWVVFCQIFGRMVDLPAGWPRYCHDLKQTCDDLGNPEITIAKDQEHHALSDARRIRKIHEFLAETHVLGHPERHRSVAMPTRMP